jgi:N-acetylmuramoyl-L-alanine amidase CwlA
LYIPIHNTGNEGKDTAKANANYFATQKKVFAGAHFIIDLDGIIYQSGRLKDACYSVGGLKWDNCDKTGGGKYYRKCTNYNQISIELAGIVDNKPTKKQIAATKAVIEYIQKYCKNAKTIIRHFDVTGKNCPDRYSGKTKQKDWEKFKKKISK